MLNIIIMHFSIYIFQKYVWFEVRADVIYFCIISTVIDALVCCLDKDMHIGTSFIASHICLNVQSIESL